MNKVKKTAIATAVTAALGVSAPASATILNFDYAGWFTLINPSGVPFNNGDADFVAPMYGWRTPISGTLTYDTDSGEGSGTMTPFSFAAGGPWETTAMTLQAIGDGAGDPGNLLMGNLSFNWGTQNAIPASIVWDATGLFGAIDSGLATSDSVSGVGAQAVTDFSLFGPKASYTLPMGPLPIATTSFDTTDIGTISLGTNPSGTLPLSDDGIGGSPMKAGSFPLYNANFDFTDLHVSSAVPVPAAVWLFGSGLVGLIGIARRKRPNIQSR